MDSASDDSEEEEVTERQVEETVQRLSQNQKERTQKVPEFSALPAEAIAGQHSYARIAVPPNRRTPLRAQWMEIYRPIVEHMKLQIRYNPKFHAVELKTSEHTASASALQKSADFVRAFLLGFEIRDAIALLRLDDLFVDSFQIKDVKTLEGEHLSRAIGRIAGQGGKTKYSIENATKTRIVLADQHVHILGSFSNIKIAKSAVVRLIMGSPPGKVYTQMRAVANVSPETTSKLAKATQSALSPRGSRLDTGPEFLCATSSSFTATNIFALASGRHSPESIAVVTGTARGQTEYKSQCPRAQAASAPQVSRSTIGYRVPDTVG
eukprot:g56596.t1